MYLQVMILHGGAVVEGGAVVVSGAVVTEVHSSGPVAPLMIVVYPEGQLLQEVWPVFG